MSILSSCYLKHNRNLKKIVLAGWDKKYSGVIILTLKRSIHSRFSKIKPDHHRNSKKILSKTVLTYPNEKHSGCLIDKVKDIHYEIRASFLIISTIKPDTCMLVNVLWYKRTSVLSI